MMVIAAWVALVSAVILVFAHIILLIVNKKYRKKITNICSIIVTIVLLPILLYIMWVSAAVLIQGENFVAYYNPGGKEMFYYNGYEYYKILDKELEMEAARYSEGHWEDADMYITDRRVDFPYWEYCIPGKIWDEFFLPEDMEPIYLMRVEQNQYVYYVREDVREEMQ